MTVEYLQTSFPVSTSETETTGTIPSGRTIKFSFNKGNIELFATGDGLIQVVNSDEQLVFEEDLTTHPGDPFSFRDNSKIIFFTFTDV